MANGSAAMIIACTECDKKFKGKPELQGKKIRCPFCKAAFTVGGVPAASKPAKPEEAPTPPPPASTATEEGRGTFNIDDVDIDPYSMKEQDLWPRCPNCANRMESKTATICLHCGYNTLTREWGETIKTIGASGGERFMHLLPGILMFTWVLTLVVGILYYSLVLPYNVYGSWANFLDSEAMRMWGTISVLGLMWGSGLYVYKRFVINPKPDEKKLE